MAKDKPELDIALLAADLYHRCINHLGLPQALAERIAGDYYAQIIIHVSWQAFRTDVAPAATNEGEPTA